MDNTRIDWATASWNPITGCLHGCQYCYAREMARRFGTRKNAYWDRDQGCICHWNGVDMPVLDSPIMFLAEAEDDSGCSGFPIAVNPYPAGFTPTFHRYHLDKPQHWKKPRNIFTVSMGDMFGDWVPDARIREVFDACAAAPQHQYLFLTKNWMRACEYRYKPNWWIGRTITHDEPCGNSDKNLYLCYGVAKSEEPAWQDHPNRFISIEPIQSAIPDLPYYAHEYGYKWVIVGAETGNRKDKVIPQRAWIEKIVDDCALRRIPVFMKSSLADIWGEPLIQEYPQELFVNAHSG